MLIKGWEGEGGDSGNGRVQSEAAGMLTQPEETASSHSGWTSLHWLSASPGLADSAVLPGASMM